MGLNVLNFIVYAYFYKVLVSFYIVQADVVRNETLSVYQYLKIKYFENHICLWNFDSIFIWKLL